MAKPREDELALGLLAVDQVRQNGGVLEHPAYSTLWLFAAMPAPGRRDVFGGFTLPINQSWWGHRAEKATWLYVVGCEPQDLPAVQYSLVPPETTVELMGRAERERTPPALAAWLVEAAARCRVQ